MEYFAGTTPLPPEQRAPAVRVDWAAVHRTTRLRPTVTSFGWPVKVLTSAPPWLLLGYLWLTGPLRVPVLALAWGLPFALVCLWWTVQTWAPAGRLPVSRALVVVPD